MEIAKLLQHKHQPASLSWSVMEPSSSSAFERYTRISTKDANNETNSVSAPKPFIAYSPFTWTNFGERKDPTISGTTDDANAYNNATTATSNLLYYNGLSHRPTTVRQPKKHSIERRPRTTFNVEQTNKLEDEYKKNEYVSRSKRVKLAQLLELSEGQVKIWFQNRRAKDKRIEKAQLDQRVRYIALNMAAMACPGIMSTTNTFETSIQQMEDS